MYLFTLGTLDILQNISLIHPQTPLLAAISRRSRELIGRRRQMSDRRAIKEDRHDHLLLGDAGGGGRRKPGKGLVIC